MLPGPPFKLVKLPAINMSLSFDTDRLLNVEPREDKLRANPEFTIVALPVVSTVKLLVDVLILPISPVVINVIAGLVSAVAVADAVVILPLAISEKDVPALAGC